jgi:hypothetical protein
MVCSPNFAGISVKKKLVQTKPVNLQIYVRTDRKPAEEAIVSEKACLKGCECPTLPPHLPQVENFSGLEALQEWGGGARQGF